MIRSITPDKKLWHMQLNLESKGCQGKNKADWDGVGPLCCWNMCWWVG